MVGNYNGGGEASSGDDQNQDPEVPSRLAHTNPEPNEPDGEKNASNRAAYDHFKEVSVVGWRHIKPVIISANFWTAVATIVIALATVLYTHYAKKQWQEMDAAGKQTDRLICLYQAQLKQLANQANNTRDLTVAAGNQVDRTKDLAARMEEEAKQTKTIASQAVIQAHAAESAAETAKDALEMENRPWVEVKAANLAEPIEIDSAGWFTTAFHLTLVNVGKSAATHVDTFVNPEPTVSDRDTAATYNLSGCDSSAVASSPAGSLAVGYALFPSQETPGPETSFLLHEQLPKVIAKLNGRPTSTFSYSIPNIITGCVSYWSLDGKTHYFTRFGYDMSLNNPGVKKEDSRVTAVIFVPESGTNTIYTYQYALPLGKGDRAEIPESWASFSSLYFGNVLK